MNLKNNYLLKKLLNWAYKKCKNFNIYMLKKNRKKKNNWRYHHFAPVYLQSWWYDLQFLRYKVWQTEFGNYRSFFALPPPLITWKTRILKKRKKWLEISSFYTCVLKTMIIRSTVPEIQSETDRIFCHFGPFFALLPP